MKPTSVHIGVSAILLSTLIHSALSQAEDRGPRERHEVSASRGINQRPARDQDAQNRRPQRPRDGHYRSLDGYHNNQAQAHMGGAFTALKRLLPADYGDGIWTPSGAHRPSARAISNAVSAQSDSRPNPLGASDFLWQWGQFLDHDIDLTDGTDPIEPDDIVVPTADAHFDPEGSGEQVIAFNRSLYDKKTGITDPRQQVNEISAWIDASNVYGSDAERAQALRTMAGDGKLKSSDGQLLPFNTEGLPNAGGGRPTLFLAGDLRANEQVGLTAMHTLFMREHNRLAEQLQRDTPNMSGEQIYQKARQLVGAQIQAITYREYLPALLGSAAIAPYRGYDESVDASISNTFSTAVYRYGHSALSPQLLRLDADGGPIAEGHLALRDAFFNPSRIIDEGGIEPILRGLATQHCQTIDTLVIDDVRNFLFGAPGAGGFDLAALNIQRGRDHGLPSYNDAREALGMGRIESVSDISQDPVAQNRLLSIYESVDDIDLWVGGLSENPVQGSHVGPLFHQVMVMQFEALRDGDRFWYTRTLSRSEREMVERSTLATIIRRNTHIGNEIPDNVFLAGSEINQRPQGPQNRPNPPGRGDRGGRR